MVLGKEADNSKRPSSMAEDVGQGSSGLHSSSLSGVPQEAPQSAVGEKGQWH